MRMFALAMFIVTAPLLSACQQQKYDYTQADANEEAALNTLEAENNDAQGIGVAGAGLIPDANGQLPMANVQ